MIIDQIAMCYISMDSSQQALQNDGIFFFNLFEKNSNRLQGVNIDEIAMCYICISRFLSQQALQKSRKFFLNLFSNLWPKTAF